MTMRKIISFIIALTPGLLLAQTAERQVIGSTGGWATSATMQVSSTVGEAVTSTQSAATVVLTQGFQQPNNYGVGIVEIKSGLSVNAYPNPASQAVTLDFKVDKPVQFNVNLLDNLGREIAPQQTLDLSTDTQKTISLSGMAAGQYFIHLSSADGSVDRSIKIIKTD
jgi:hypothetical protein